MFLAFFTYLNEAVMYVISFAAVMVLLTSLIGLAIWIPRLMWARTIPLAHLRDGIG
jgi:hypothetical protein